MTAELKRSAPALKTLPNYFEGLLPGPRMIRYVMLLVRPVNVA